MMNGLYEGQMEGLRPGQQAGITVGLFSNDTKNNGIDAFGVIGDSNANGAATTNQTTCPPDTLYNFNHTNIYQITTQTVNTEIPDGRLGSFMQPFANEYKKLTGRKTLLINGAHGQSVVYTGVYSWYTSGFLYADFKAKVERGLATSGINKLKGIIINVGINDLRVGTTVADITTGYQSLISRLTTDFPDVPILIIQVGRSETIITNNNYYRVREMIVDLANANANVHMCGSAVFFAPLTTTYYESDALHYNGEMMKVLGRQLATWFTIPEYSKWGRSVIASMFNLPDHRRRKLIDNFISSQVTSGNYFVMDALHVLKTNSELNLYMDWSFMGAGFKRSSTWIENDSVSTDGVATYYDTSYNSTDFTSRSTTTDMLFGVKVKTRTTTTASSLLGASNLGVIFNLLQQASPSTILYRSYDATNSAGTDVLVQANTLYSVGRSGTTKNIFKDKTSHASAVQAATGSTSNYTFGVGAINASGTRSGFLAASFEYVFAASQTGFNLTSFYDEMEALIAAW